MLGSRTRRVVIFIFNKIHDSTVVELIFHIFRLCLCKNFVCLCVEFQSFAKKIMQKSLMQLIKNTLCSAMPALSFHTFLYLFFFQISLEFYQKKKTRWMFSTECIPWEVWTIKLDILTLSNESGRSLIVICYSSSFL